MADSHKNFAYSTVATAPSPATSGTSLVVGSGDGTKFPAVPFNATIWPAGSQPTTANAEIVRVTNISTDTFTITRTQEGTAARTVVVGDQIAATITAKTITDAEVGTQLDYVEKTSNTTVSSSNEASPTNVVSGNAVSYDGSTRVKIEFFCYTAGAPSGQDVVLNLWDGSTDLGRIAFIGSSTTDVAAQVHAARFLTPSNASHTYHIKAWTTSGTGTIFAGAGGVGTATPAWIQITKA